MTGVPEPSIPRTDPRAGFIEYLDFFRAEVRRTCSGLGEAELATSIVPSGWTLPTMVEHLVHMERRWLVWGFVGEDVPRPRADRAADGSFVTDRPIGVLLDALDEGGRRTRSIVENHDLADRATVGGMFASGDSLPTLLSILLHVSQEYARHLGHIDIARELIDGLVGDD
ncbi:DinB family protein [Aeromicrobium panaciterrae]|uniref:mycothiol transferase n=1 Tax=Aeromicrobium panaciterrae TaxID=363861 RepID=UPI0031E285AC